MRLETLTRLIWIALAALTTLVGCTQSPTLHGNADGYDGLIPDCRRVKCPTFHYAGSGTDWRFSLNDDGAFTANELTTPASVDGIYSRLDSGFVKLVVLHASGTGAPEVGKVRYGLELPGLTFLVQAMLSSEKGIITAVGTGKCPSQDFTSNWILTQYLPWFDMSDPSANVFGTFHWDQAGSVGSVPVEYAIAGDYQQHAGGSATLTGQCTDGVITGSFGGLPTSVYYADPGAAVVKFGGIDGVLALPAAPLGDPRLLTGDYAGLIINLNDVLFPVRPIQGVIDESGTHVRVDGLMGVDPVAIDPLYNGTASLDVFNAPGDGFAEVTVTTGNGTGKMACMIAARLLSSSRNVLFCTGQAPGASYNRYAYNILLVSK